MRARSRAAGNASLGQHGPQTQASLQSTMGMASTQHSSDQNSNNGSSTTTNQNSNSGSNSDDDNRAPPPPPPNLVLLQPLGFVRETSVRAIIVVSGLLVARGRVVGSRGAPGRRRKGAARGECVRGGLRSV